MPARIRPTFSTYSARDIDDDQADVGTPGQHAAGSAASRTSANRAQVTRPSKVTTAAGQPAVSSAAKSSVTSPSPVASRPPNHASGAGPSVEAPARRLGGRHELREQAVDRDDLVGDVAVLLHGRDIA